MNRNRVLVAAGAVVLVIAVAVVAFLAGRSADEPTAAAASPSASASPSPAVPADGGSYFTLTQLVAAMPEQCAGLRSPASPPPDRSSGMCDTSTGQVSAVIYFNQTDRDRDAQAVPQAFFLKGRTMLVGKNWTLFGPDALIERCQAKMGGTLVQTPR